jgi:proline iminopeptidase
VINPSRRSLVAGLAASLMLPAAVEKAAAMVPSLADTTGRAAVPGGSVWWRKIGAGPKTPLLLLHGGPGAGHNYLLPLKALADERPVIFYDQLGCGQSESPGDESLYTVQRSVDEVDAVRSALGLDRIVLFGHSWGSMLAIEYLCQDRGEGVEKLILGGALASVPQCMAGQQRLIDAMPHGAGKRLHALESAHQEESPEYQKLVGLFYDRHVCRRKPLPPEAAETFAIVGKSIAYRVMNGPNEFTITGIIKDWDRRADLDHIKMPTLITTGEFDEVTLDCHETIHQGVAGSTLEIFKGCSHMTMSEQPKQYVAALRGFLG